MTRHALLALVMLVPAGVAAQGRSDETARANEQARRLLEDGRSYRAQGMLKQAMDNFGTIVSAWGGTDSVDDALLEIGRYHMEVEGDVEKARVSFEQVIKAYPQSDGAPGAYYWLGRLTLSRATTAAELDDALAQFGRVQRLYPRSEWVAHALYASGLVHRKAGRLLDAVEVLRRAVLEYPQSDAAPAAQFELGRCYALLMEPRQAMEEFQQVRNRFAESTWAAQALDRTTALYRLYGAGAPRFALDTGYGLALGDILKDVTALQVSPDRILWIASGKSRSAVSVGADGKMTSSLPLDAPRSITFSPKGEILVTGELAVRMGSKDIKTFAVPGEKAGVMETLERMTAVAMLPSGSVLVSDLKKRRVFRFDEQLRFQGPFPDDKAREIVRIALDGEGAILLLDQDEKTVRSYDVLGRPLRAIGPKGPGLELKRPADLAVDAFRNTYVADGAGAVYVFDVQGQLLTTITGELRRPAALTLEPDGTLLVYDEKLEKVLRFR